MSEGKFIGLCLLILLVCAVLCAKCDEAIYRGGKCVCGGTLVYEQAVGHRYTTSYIYRCDNCGGLVETSFYMN